MPGHLYDHSHMFLWMQEAKRLFSDLMKVCGDPTLAQRSRTDDPNILLFEKAMSSINNQRATWLKAYAKAKTSGKSQHAHTPTGQAKPRPA